MRCKRPRQASTYNIPFVKSRLYLRFLNTSFLQGFVLLQQRERHELDEQSDKSMIDYLKIVDICNKPCSEHNCHHSKKHKLQLHELSS